MVQGNGKPQAAGRLTNGQFAPGCSGNPKGSSRGVGLMSQLNAQLDLDDGKLRWRFIERTIELALEGDSASLKILWDRLEPAVNVNLNHNVEPSEILDTLAQVRARVANGKGAQPGSH